MEKSVSNDAELFTVAYENRGLRGVTCKSWNFVPVHMKFSNLTRYGRYWDLVWNAPGGSGTFDV